MPPKGKSKRSNGTKTKTAKTKVVTKTFIGPKLNKASKRGRATSALKNNKHTFQQMLVSDGLNKALQMHNNSLIIDKFPRRMEKVTDLSFTTPSAFSNSYNYYVNPGNSLLFPIFSQVAAVYEQYRCRFLKFHYVSEEYTASGSNIVAGKLIMATNADPDDPAFSSATAMENYIGSDRTAPYSSVTHDALLGLSKNKNKRGLSFMPLTEYFVNSSGNSPAPIDQQAKFYDLGLFQLAVSGLPVAAGNLEIGELYVEYEFDMIRPRELAKIGANLNAAHISEYPYGSADSVYPLGTSINGTIKTGSTIPVFTSNSGGVQRIWWNIPGNFLVLLYATGTGTLIGSSPFNTMHSVIFQTMWQDNSAPRALAGDSTNLKSINAFILVNYDSLGLGGFTFTVPDQSSGSLDIWIAQVPATINTIADVSVKQDDNKILSSSIVQLGEVDHLKTQVKELGGMLRAFLSQPHTICAPDVPDVAGPDDDFKSPPTTPTVVPKTNIKSRPLSVGPKTAWF